MKKLIALLLALILVFSFAACKKDAPSDPSDEQISTDETPAEEEQIEEVPEVDYSNDLPIVMDDGTILNPDGSVYGEEPEVEEPEVEEPEVEETPAADSAALNALNAIWGAYGEDEKFAIIGGNMEAGIMDQPGVWDPAYKEGLTTTLLIPAEQLANVTEAATMIHMMNTNTFTGGVVKLADGTDAAAFAQAVRDAIQNNQWLCGFPEKLIISDLGDGCILIAYGINDAMTVFEGHLATAFAGAQSLFSEAIGG